MRIWTIIQTTVYFYFDDSAVVNNNVIVFNFYKQDKFVLNSLFLNSMPESAFTPPPFPLKCITKVLATGSSVGPLQVTRY